MGGMGKSCPVPSHPRYLLIMESLSTAGKLLYVVYLGC